jgi:hypothetical protein
VELREMHGIPGGVSHGSQYLTDWNGFYVGGKLGGAWGDADWHQVIPSDFDPTGVIGNTTLSSSGVAGGVFGGANLQIGPMDLWRRALVLGRGPFLDAREPVLSRHRHLLD